MNLRWFVNIGCVNIGGHLPRVHAGCLEKSAYSTMVKIADSAAIVLMARLALGLLAQTIFRYYPYCGMHRQRRLHTVIIS